MPRKRRFPKRRPPLPEGLEQITLAERAQWAADGPLLTGDVAGDAMPGYVIWPSWQAFFTFYGAVRDELYAEQPWRRDRSAAERLWTAYHAGEDAEAVRARMRASARRHDPRLSLGQGHAA